MVVISLESRLTSREGIRGNACGVKSHAHKRYRLALSGGDEHVQLSSGRLFIDFVGETKQRIGLFAHSTHDQNNVITAASRPLDVISYLAHAVSVSDRGTSEFLNNECHKI
jgi:hypothetical protein